MQIRFNKEKFKSELSDKMKPGTSWWALAGIVFFFFVPEIVAYVWGEEIIAYVKVMMNATDDYAGKKFYEMLTMFGENSILNILIGFGFVGWFFHERAK